MQRSHRLIVVPLVLLATVGFAACGDDAEQKPADTEVMMTESTEAMMTESTGG